jgi:hypothetical protein
MITYQSFDYEIVLGNCGLPILAFDKCEMASGGSTSVKGMPIQIDGHGP